MDELADGVEYFKNPNNGEFTGSYFINDEGTVKVARLIASGDIVQAMNDYEWIDGDILLATYPKNGTHFMWEVMMMLVRDSADYIEESKHGCMIDMYPVTESHELVPSPRVLNTHYRLDVLPKTFRGKKTVCVLRNPKDVAASFYFHRKKRVLNIGMDEKKREELLAKLTFSAFLGAFLFDNDCPYGRYFDYVEYMWSLRDDPNLLLVHFEDLKRDPVEVIQQVNEFMGTSRSPELVQNIAEATNFASMREGKKDSTNRLLEKTRNMKEQGEGSKEKRLVNGAQDIYRKGEIGDWKNHFTVADNELFDACLDRWAVGNEIPFRY